jgi:hypothetical protein
MAQPPKVEKHGEFGVTSQFVIEVQPLFIRNSFQQFFACVPSHQSKSLLFKPRWVWNKIPMSSADRIVQRFSGPAKTPSSSRLRLACATSEAKPTRRSVIFLPYWTNIIQRQ